MLKITSYAEYVLNAFAKIPLYCTFFSYWFLDFTEIELLLIE